MANPFDQFGEYKPPVAQIPAADVTQSAPPQPNAFDQPTQAPQMTKEEFDNQLYDKLNSGITPEALVEWSKTTPFELVPNDNLLANVKEGARAHAAGEKGHYGENVLTPGGGSDLVGDLGAMVRQGSNTALMNFGDEIGAGLAAIPQTLAGDGTLEENYNRNWQDLNIQDQYDQMAHPTAHDIGTGIGVAGSVFLPGAINTRGMGLAARMGIGAGEGAAIGGVSATGEGKPGDRFGKTVEGALAGGAIGGGLPAAATAVGRVVRPVTERIAARVNPESSGVTAFARRLGLKPGEIGAMRDRVAEQTDLVGNDGVALIDVLPERGRNVVGAAGVRDDARETLQNAAAARTAELPERVQRQADRISADLRTPDELRGGITEARDADIQAALDPIRRTPLPLTQDIADVLSTRAGLRAIRKAIDTEPSVAGRNQLEELRAGMERLRRSIDPRLPEETQQRMQGEILDALPFDINASERISRVMNEMGRGGESAMFGFGRTVRDAANVSPRFQEIMSNYGTASRSADAVTAGQGGQIGREQAGGFLKERPDRFEGRAAALSNDVPRSPVTDSPPGEVERANDGLRQAIDDTAQQFNIAPDRVRQAMQEPDFRAQVEMTLRQRGLDPSFSERMPQSAPIVRIGDQAAPTERQLMQAGAADAVRRAAGDVTGAASVARQLATSPDQMRRTVAAVGEQEARTINRAMDAELNRVQRVQRQATQSGPARAAEGGAGAENFANALYNPGPISAGREALRFLHRIGITDQDASWIVQNSLNPAVRDQVINRLEQAGIDSIRAQAYVDMLSTMGVRGATTTED